MQYEKQPTLVRYLDDVVICTSTAKTFRQTFSSRIGTFIWWYVDCSARGLHITRLKRKSKIKKKLLPFSKKIVVASEHYYNCVNALLSFSCANLLHGTCLLTGFNFSIKILLAKMLLLLNSVMLSAQYAVDLQRQYFFVVVLLFRCSTGVLLFFYSMVFRLFRQCSAVLAIFRVSQNRVPVFLVYSMPSPLPLVKSDKARTAAFEFFRDKRKTSACLIGLFSL